MIRQTLVIAALLASAPATAQTAQDELDARYDRALAAGYKALMLCSAIANAERNGAVRTPESVAEWELAGIQAPLDGIIGELSYSIRRHAPEAPVDLVAVNWAENAAPRIAKGVAKQGCRLQPMGTVLPLPHSSADESGRNAPAATAIPMRWGSERSSLALGKRIAGPIDGAFDGRYGAGTRTTAVLFKRGDAIVEQYADDFDALTPQRTWSVAKSIAATLVGAAVYRVEADVGASAGLGAGESDPRRAITLDHLLRMASGRYSDTPGNRTDPLYFGGSTVEETALHWPLVHEPGSVYRYANNDTLAAVEAIEPTFEEHPPAALFARLGMNHTVAETDWQGNYILSSQVWSTARDLAKLGELYLRDGVWNGTRILPEDWLEYVSRPSGPQPEGEFGYGAGFWLMNRSPGIPPDTIAAMGNRGQFIIIVPKMNVVIVRRGEDPAGSRFDIAAFTRNVLESLGE